MRRWVAVLPLLLAALVGGCVSSERPGGGPMRVARLFLESGGDEGVPAVLPRSGVTLQLNPKPVLTEADLAGADVAEVELGRCLLLYLNSAAARDFYRLTVTHQGRRLALQLDGVVIGARRIDGPVADGKVFLFVEMPDESLPGLVEGLRATAESVRRKTGEKR